MARIPTGGATVSNTSLVFPNTGFTAIGVTSVELSLGEPSTKDTLNKYQPFVRGTVALSIGAAASDNNAPRVALLGSPRYVTNATSTMDRFTSLMGNDADDGSGQGLTPTDITVAGVVGNTSTIAYVSNTFLIAGYRRSTGNTELHVSPPYTINYNGVPQVIPSGYADSKPWDKIASGPSTGSIYMGYSGWFSNTIKIISNCDKPYSNVWLRASSERTLSTNSVYLVADMVEENNLTGGPTFLTIYGNSSDGVVSNGNLWIDASYSQYDSLTNTYSEPIRYRLPIYRDPTGQNIQQSVLSAAYSYKARNTIVVASVINRSGATRTRFPGVVYTRPYNTTYDTSSSAYTMSSLPGVTTSNNDYYAKVVCVNETNSHTPPADSANVVMLMTKTAGFINTTHTAISSNGGVGGWLSKPIVANTSVALDWQDMTYHVPTNEFVLVARGTNDVYTCLANSSNTAWTKRTGVLPGSNDYWTTVISLPTLKDAGKIVANTLNISSTLAGSNVQSCIVYMTQYGGVAVANTPSDTATLIYSGSSSTLVDTGFIGPNSNTVLRGLANQVWPNYFVQHGAWGMYGIVNSPYTGASSIGNGFGGLAYTDDPRNVWRNQLIPSTFYGITEKIADIPANKVSANTSGYRPEAGQIAVGWSEWNGTGGGSGIPTTPHETNDAAQVALILTSNTTSTTVALRDLNAVGIANGTNVYTWSNTYSFALAEGKWLKPAFSRGVFRSISANGSVITIAPDLQGSSNVTVVTQTSSNAYPQSNTYAWVGIVGDAASSGKMIALRADGLIVVDSPIANSDVILETTTVQLYTDNWKAIVYDDGVYTAYGNTYVATSSDGAKWNIGAAPIGTLGITGDHVVGNIGREIISFGANTTSPMPTKSITPTTKQMALGPFGGGAPRLENKAWVWGYNQYGQLGDTTYTNKSSPIQTIARGGNWVELVTGVFSTAGIKADGTLWTWGLDTAGQLGGGGTSPAAVFGNGWSKVSLGRDTMALIKVDGTLWMTGNNSVGQIGDNTITTRTSPVQTVAGGTWSQVSAALATTAAIKTDGTLWLWGKVVGQGTVSSPIQVTGGGNTWKQVSLEASGDVNVAAIKTDGTLWTWGDNTYGQIGDGTTTTRNSPVQTVAGGTNWKQVTAGGYYSMAAVKTDGTLWTWGYNQSGYLADGTKTNKSSPVQVLGQATTWNQVSFAQGFCAAVKTDGTLWTWGNNQYGGMGDSTTTNKSSPVQTTMRGTQWSSVSAGSTMAAIEAYRPSDTIRGWWSTTTPFGFNPDEEFIPVAEFEQSYAGSLSNECRLWGWGYGSSGGIGDNSITNKSSPVQTIAGGANWKQVATVGNSSAAIKNDGTLWAWGSNNNGQLGDGTITNRSSPVQTIARGNDWKQVAMYTHIAAIKNDGTLWMWGTNNVGQLGDNTTTNRSSPVQTIAGGNTWKQVAAGNGSTAAIKTDGTLWTWGSNNYGQLGDTTFVNKSSPVQTVARGTAWSQVAIGGTHMGAIKTDGTLWMWGSGTYGELGNLSIAITSSPVQTVAGGNNWKQLATGIGYSAAIKTDGTLWTWGYNGSGELGDSTAISRSSPVQTIAGGTNWKQVRLGNGLTAAIKADGTLWIWGGNQWGSLGDNTITNRSSPVQTIAGGTNWKDVAIWSTTLALEYTR